MKNETLTSVTGLQYVENGGQLTIVGFSDELIEVRTNKSSKTSADKKDSDKKDSDKKDSDKSSGQNSEEIVKMVRKYPFPANLTIPSTIAGKKVVRIAQGAFHARDELTTVVVSEGVRYIEAHAFSYCRRLNDVKLPGSLLGIGGCAFAECWALREIDVLEGVTTIGGGAFAGCSALKRAALPSTLELLDGWAFYNCPVRSIEVADGNVRFSSVDGALVTNGGETLVHSYAQEDGTPFIPDGVETIGDVCFSRNRDLTSAAPPASVTRIGDYAFYGCVALRRFVTPNAAIEFGKRVFERCPILDWTDPSED